MHIQSSMTYGSILSLQGIGTNKVTDFTNYYHIFLLLSSLHHKMDVLVHPSFCWLMRYLLSIVTQQNRNRVNSFKLSSFVKREENFEMDEIFRIVPRSDLASLYCILLARSASHQALIDDEYEVWAANTLYQATFKTEYR